MLPEWRQKPEHQTKGKKIVEKEGTEIIIGGF
jgi:hypothetical protein